MFTTTKHICEFGGNMLKCTTVVEKAFYVSKIETVPCSSFTTFCVIQGEGKAAKSQVNFAMFCLLGCLPSNGKAGFSLL